MGISLGNQKGWVQRSTSFLGLGLPINNLDTDAIIRISEVTQEIKDTLCY